jgi:hypothetical protein
MLKRLALISCRQAHVLLSQRMDAPLGPLGRYRLLLHLKICDACTRVDGQFTVLRDAMRRLEP